MITFSTFKSAIVENGARILKIIQFGPKTADECAPFGDDSNPLADMTAIYADTSEYGEQVIIGYINNNQLAEPGEKRLYSVKPDGSVGFYLWLKNGVMEIGGNVNNLVRFKPLETGIHSTDTEINVELAKIAVAISTLGGSYVPGNISTDLSAAKIEEIKSL